MSVFCKQFTLLYIQSKALLKFHTKGSAKQFSAKLCYSKTTGAGVQLHGVVTPHYKALQIICSGDEILCSYNQEI